MLNAIDTTNLETLREIIGDDLKEIIKNFIETSPEILEKIKSSLDKKNASDLKLHAHTLKGSCANIGAVSLPDLSFKLELKASEGIAENLDTEYMAVVAELSNVNNALKSYIANSF